MTCVLIPYLPGKLHVETMLTVTQQLRPGWAVDMVDVSGSDEAYWQAVDERWNHGRDLVIVEHDVELVPHTFDEFDACPQLWCAHSYAIYWGGIAETYGGPWGLGCVRYRAELQAMHPGLLEDVSTFKADANGVIRDGRYWMNFDAAMAQWLRGPYRHVAHRHLPDAIHHHQYDYAGAYVTDEVRANLPDGHPLKEAPVG